MTLRTAVRNLLLALALTGVGAGACLTAAAAPVDRTPRTTAPSGRIVLKFAAGSGLTPRAGGLIAADPTVAARFEALLAELAPGAVLAPRIAAPPAELAALRAAAAAKSGRALPALAGWATLTPAGSDGDPAVLAAALRRLPEIATAYAEPEYQPSGLRDGPPPDKSETLSDSGDFSPLQGYRGEAPVGVNAIAVADLPGGRGQDVRIIDVEADWYWNHEDLNSPFHLSGTGFVPPSSRYHGTATLGVLNGADNGFGVVGLAPDSPVGGAAYISQSLADAIYKAVKATEPGDIILIEVHGPGPNANGLGDYGYVPVEYWEDNYEMILTATAMGRVVIEAGGNGQQDLDDPIYLDLFDRDVRDSGAVYVGAGYPQTLVPEWFTNHGSRFDVHCWGEAVVTTGYGDLQGVDEGFYESQWYTQLFAGTSSASAIVAGAAAVLQGLMRAEYGFPLDPLTLRTLLGDTGSPQAPDPDYIGPRPDLLAAWSAIAGGVGALRGRITDATTGLPIENAVMTVSSHGRQIRTDDEGLYLLTTGAGPVTFDIDSYFHDPLSLSVVVDPGVVKQRDIGLVPLRRITVSGFAVGEDSLHLGELAVTPRGVPVPGVLTRSDGAYDLPGLPEGKPVTLLFHRLSGYGAAVAQIVPRDILNGFHPLDIELPLATERFEETAGFHSSSTAWQWASSPAGPDTSFSMPGCWGVGAFGDYANNVNSTLYSPDYAFPGATQVRLSLHYWCDTEAGYDGANLWIEQGAEWILLTPLNLYEYDHIYATGGLPGWSGYSLDWRGAVFDLAGFDLSTFRIKFVFRSNASESSHGFFFDDLSFDFGDRIVAVAPDGSPSVLLALTARPNPFNPSTEISWTAARPGRLRIDVHDARGRVVRRLLDRSVETEAGVVVWDGRGDDGRAAGSGIYLVRIRDAAGHEAGRRVTLVR